MVQATIAPPTIKTVADLQTRLGGIPLDRIWFRPAPGTAVENDVIEAEAHENRLCELVDGTLVAKAVGFESLGWLIDPRKRTARVFSTPENSVLVRAHQSLDGADVLPGFILPLADFLDHGRRPVTG